MKKIILTTVLLISLVTSLHTQNYYLVNHSFENLVGTSPSGHSYNGFKWNNLGPSWYPFHGSPRSEFNGFNNINAQDGNRFAHTWHKLKHHGQWERTGQSFYMYYPMSKGLTYTVSFWMKTQGHFDHVYLLATNDAVTNTQPLSNLNNDMDVNLSGSINTIFPNNGVQLVGNVTYHSPNQWKKKTFTFIADKDYHQLVFMPYLDIPTWNFGYQTMNLYIDNVSISGSLAPGRVELALNGFNANQHIGIAICDGEEVILDGKGTIDNFLPLNYFIQIYKQNDNGTKTLWYDRWFNGIPNKPINLSQIYPHGFSAAEGTTSEYNVKLAINANPTNAWIERTLRVIVNGGPSFNFGLNLIQEPGDTTTREVKNLVPSNGVYSYKWYRGSTASGNVISTNKKIYITKNFAGNYPYTVEVTNSITGCKTIKTTTVVYRTVVSTPVITEKSKENTIDTAQDNEDVIIYPNPTKSILNIKSKENFDWVKILDINGNTLLTSKQRKLDLTKFKKGVYLVNIYSNNKLISQKKIIKE